MRAQVCIGRAAARDRGREARRPSAAWATAAGRWRGAVVSLGGAVWLLAAPLGLDAAGRAHDGAEDQLRPGAALERVDAERRLLLLRRGRRRTAP